jgi:Cu-Zn family superoxide dismutase
LLRKDLKVVIPEVLFMKKIIFSSLVAGLILFSTAMFSNAQDIVKVIAVLNPTQNNKVTGIVTFSKVELGVKVVADIKGLTPGAHGFHIHQFGDCSAPNADSAGGHYNPAGKPHGAPESGERHAGDLGNLVADGSGKAYLERTDSIISLSGLTSIIGRGIIIHEASDDMTTQPTGNAGARVACGVIGIAGP